MKRKAPVVSRLSVVVVAGMAVALVAAMPSDVSTAAKRIYSGTLYIAGMGGHFAKAEVSIDPADARQPIKVKLLDRIVIGSKDTHPTHDARIDVKDRTRMFWSTYRPDPSGKMHVGVSDLKTGKVVKDVAVDLDPRAKEKKSVYCASGQTANSFLPVTMTDEPYIDVFDKKTFALKHRVFLDYKPGETKFYHGVNSPDMKRFMVAVNLADDGVFNGKIDLWMLDLPALEKGKVKVLARNTIEGEPFDTVTFRQYFSEDGKRIYQSGGDRLIVIDATNLKLVSEAMLPSGSEVHDAMPTPDGKYVIMAVRKQIPSPAADGKKIVDGVLMLYDVEARKVVNETASVCVGCHQQLQLYAHSMLCGVDGNWRR